MATIKNPTKKKKPTKKANPYLSSETLGDLIAERAARDVEFAVAYRRADARRALANAIRVARQKRSITQAALARAVGTRQPNIARLEAGRGEPGLAQLSRIATALHLVLDIRFIAPTRATAR